MKTDVRRRDEYMDARPQDRRNQKADHTAQGPGNRASILSQKAAISHDLIKGFVKRTDLPADTQPDSQAH